MQVTTISKYFSLTLLFLEDRIGDHTRYEYFRAFDTQCSIVYQKTSTYEQTGKAS